MRLLCNADCQTKYGTFRAGITDDLPDDVALSLLKNPHFSKFEAIEVTFNTEVVEVVKESLYEVTEAVKSIVEDEVIVLSVFQDRTKTWRKRRGVAKKVDPEAEKPDGDPPAG